MINSVGHDICCGCEACAQVCPKHCIQMREDCEGFLFPQTDVAKCLQCGKCLKVCPALSMLPKISPAECYAYRAKDVELLRRTSSGGFFTLAAERTLADGGVVFGAAFNEVNEVIHRYIESSNEIDLLRRSKYVQSRVGSAYMACKAMLEAGRKVLFCGTPCQIKALNLFLGKKYDNLTTIDFICHGVPSPGVFRRYLSELADGKGYSTSELHDINFRDKGLGFAYAFSFSFSFSFSFYRESPIENLFLKGFLNDLFLRRSCHNCRAKGFSSGADYTMCDFWTVNKFLPGFADKSVPGVNQVFVADDKLGLFAGDSLLCVRKLDMTCRGLVQIWAKESVPMTRHRDWFFSSYLAGDTVEVSILKGCETTRVERLANRVRGLFCSALRRVGVR